MKTVAAIRVENLELLIAEIGTQDKVSELADTSSIYLSQLRNRALDSKTGRPREMGARMARRIEVGCGKPHGWMDHDHSPASYRQEQLQLAVKAMETLPDYEFDKAIKIIYTLAEPATPH